MRLGRTNLWNRWWLRFGSRLLCRFRGSGDDGLNALLPSRLRLALRILKFLNSGLISMLDLRGRLRSRSLPLRRQHELREIVLRSRSLRWPFVLRLMREYEYTLIR